MSTSENTVEEKNEKKTTTEAQAPQEVTFPDRGDSTLRENLGVAKCDPGDDFDFFEFLESLDSLLTLFKTKGLELWRNRLACGLASACDCLSRCMRTETPIVSHLVMIHYFSQRIYVKTYHSNRLECLPTYAILNPPRVFSESEISFYALGHSLFFLQRALDQCVSSLSEMQLLHWNEDTAMPSYPRRMRRQSKPGQTWVFNKNAESSKTVRPPSVPYPLSGGKKNLQASGDRVNFSPPLPTISQHASESSSFNIPPTALPVHEARNKKKGENHLFLLRGLLEEPFQIPSKSEKASNLSKTLAQEIVCTYAENIMCDRNLFLEDYIFFHSCKAVVVQNDSTELGFIFTLFVHIELNIMITHYHIPVKDLERIHTHIQSLFRGLIFHSFSKLDFDQETSESTRVWETLCKCVWMIIPDHVSLCEITKLGLSMAKHRPKPETEGRFRRLTLELRKILLKENEEACA